MMPELVRIPPLRLQLNDRWFAFALALVFLFITIAPGPATSIMLDQDAGPYKITVGANPVPLQVGQNHISILIQRRSNALVVRDAQVTVAARPLEGTGPAVTQPATHDQAADERQYGTPLVLDKPGRWEIIIQIEGPDGPWPARRALRSG